MNEKRTIDINMILSEAELDKMHVRLTAALIESLLHYIASGVSEDAFVERMRRVYRLVEKEWDSVVADEGAGLHE